MTGSIEAKSMRRAWRFLLSCLLAVSAIATSPWSPAQAPGYICENNGATRTVEVVTAPGYACRVRYTKPSGTSFPWSARNDASYCGPRAIGLVNKLRSLGWACDSTDVAKSILLAQIENYHRHIRILTHVGKTCDFYPGEAQFGDLCGDPRQEAVVVYTCEKGADDWEQHLAVFLEIENDPLIREIGDSRSRQVTSYHIDKHRLLLEIQPFDTDGETPTARSPPVQTSIQCRYTAESKWKLDEQ
jgi:hypothetical protein